MWYDRKILFGWIVQHSIERQINWIPLLQTSIEYKIAQCRLDSVDHLRSDEIPFLRKFSYRKTSKNKCCSTNIFMTIKCTKLLPHFQIQYFPLFTRFLREFQLTSLGRWQRIRYFILLMLCHTEKFSTKNNKRTDKNTKYKVIELELRQIRNFRKYP